MRCANKGEILHHSSAVYTPNLPPSLSHFARDASPSSLLALSLSLWQSICKQSSSYSRFPPCLLLISVFAFLFSLRRSKARDRVIHQSLWGLFLFKLDSSTNSLSLWRLLSRYARDSRDETEIFLLMKMTVELLPSFLLMLIYGMYMFPSFFFSSSIVAIFRKSRTPRLLLARVLTWRK